MVSPPAVSSLSPLRVATQEFAETSFVHPASGEFEDGLRRRFLACREAITIEFEKEHANNETRALVAIDEGVILHNARCVLSGKIDDIGARVGEMVQRPCECRLEECFVTQTLSAPVLDKLPIVDRERELVRDPNRLAHFDRTWSVFR